MGRLTGEDAPSTAEQLRGQDVADEAMQQSCQALCLQAAELKRKLLRQAEELKRSRTASMNPSHPRAHTLHSPSPPQEDAEGSLSSKRLRDSTEESGERGMAVKQEVLMQQQGEVPLQPLLHELREQGAVAPISPDVAGMDEVKCDPGLGQELDDREGEEDDNPNFVGKGALRRRWRKRATLDQLQVWYLTHLVFLLLSLQLWVLLYDSGEGAGTALCSP